MKIAHAESGADTSAAIRGGARAFKTLLAGDDMAPDNYRVVLARQSGRVSVPRHRHNFDQIRMCLEGDPQNYGPNRWIKPGEIAYFPEGAAYGPEESDASRLGITFQFGGASGNGFVSSAHTKKGMEELKAFGAFEKGVFIRAGDLAPGQKRNQDSFEAVWEHINKRKLEYPSPRYEEPVLIKPDNFAWRDEPGAPGVAMKRLGAFSERYTEIALMRLAPGARATITKRPGLQVAFVLKGSGEADGEPIRLHTGVEIAANDTPVFSSGEGLNLLLVGLPIFEESQRAAA